MLHIDLTKIRTHGRRLRSRFITFVLLILLASASVLIGFAKNLEQDIDKFNRFVQSSTTGDTASSKLFIEGRTLIANSKWTEAAKKFNQIIKDYPRSENVDVALYWLAYANKEQEKYAEADRSLERIVKEYPNSTWVTDAQTMRALIGPYLGREDEVVGDSKDEIRIAALQSLFNADPARGAARAAALLKRDSGASPLLKEYAIELLGQYGGKDVTPILIEVARNEQDIKLRKRAIYSLGWRADDNIASMLRDMVTNSNDEEIAQAALWALTRSSEQGKKSYALLIQIAKSGKTNELRKQAISSLFRLGDDKVIDELVDIYRANNDVEIKRAVISALGSNGRFTPVILSYSGGLNSEYVGGPALAATLAARDELLSLVPLAPPDPPEPAQTTRSSGAASPTPAAPPASGQNIRPGAIASTAPVARAGQGVNLYGNVSVNSAAKQERAAAVLVQLFDSEKDESLKSDIVAALGRSGQKQATKKLMEIARSESSLVIKKRAIAALSMSKDPEVLSFLEELVK